MKSLKPEILWRWIQHVLVTYNRFHALRRLASNAQDQYGVVQESCAQEPWAWSTISTATQRAGITHSRPETAGRSQATVSNLWKVRGSSVCWRAPRHFLQWVWWLPDWLLLSSMSLYFLQVNSGSNEPDTHCQEEEKKVKQEQEMVEKEPWSTGDREETTTPLSFKVLYVWKDIENVYLDWMTLSNVILLITSAAREVSSQPNPGTQHGGIIQSRPETAGRSQATVFNLWTYLDTWNMKEYLLLSTTTLMLLSTLKESENCNSRKPNLTDGGKQEKEGEGDRKREDGGGER